LKGDPRRRARIFVAVAAIIAPIVPTALAQTAPAPKAAARPGSELKAIAALIAEGRLAPAEQRLRAILAQGGGPAARALLGVVLAQQGKPEEAEREFQSALQANPALLDVRQQLARLYLAGNREGDAMVELRRAAKAGPLERDLALKLAGAEVADGHPALAERQLRSAAERFDSVQALMQLARLQSSRKDAKGALETLARARKLAPSSEEVLSASAQLALAVRAPVPAILSLEPLTRMCASVGQYPYLLGVALMQAGDMLAAVEPLQQAEKLEPNRVLTLVALGLAFNGTKRYAEAKPVLLHAIELEPDNVEGVAALAEAEEGLGESREAETHAERALARADGHATANLVLGMVRMTQERYPDARDLLEKAVAGDPSSPKAYYQLSLAYARLGEQAAAERQVAQYRQKLREIEERVNQLRAATGTTSGGMGR
jgi:tetratricopeptide (TPR) repeat protein